MIIIFWRTLSLQMRLPFTYLFVSVDITAGSGMMKTHTSSMNRSEILRQLVYHGMAKNQIYDPFFSDERTVSGTSYLYMLQNFFVPQLQQPPGLLRRVIFQQDGAPPHFAQDVRAYLDQTFTERR